MLLSTSGVNESRLRAPSAEQSFAALCFSAAERERDMSIPRKNRVDESDAVHRELVPVGVAVDERRERVRARVPSRHLLARSPPRRASRQRRGRAVGAE